VSLTSAAGELGQGLKVVRAVWEDARAGWQDAVAADFDRQHWTPLADQVVATAEAIDRLAPILARLYRECS
jgi:hypothetical protein